MGPAGAVGADGEAGPQGADGPEGPAGSPDTAEQVLAKLITVDGIGSGLDADTLDGHDSSYFATATELAAKVEEAPNDLVVYGRYQEEWVPTVEEAPNDGLIRGRLGGIWLPVPEEAPGGSAQGRKDGVWVPVLEDAPNDNLVYGRFQETWIPVIWDSAWDGKTYARKDGVWVENEAHKGPIVFPAAQASSSDVNTLDDYEEGTWTPTYVPGGGAYGAITYAATAGYYTKIGRQVTVVGQIQTNAFALGTGSGVAQIGGLPFTSISGGNYAGMVAIGFRAAFTAGQQQPGGGSIFPSSTRINLHTVPAGTTNGAGFLVASMAVGAVAGQNQINFSATYFTN